MSDYIMYLRKSRQDDPNESVEEVLSRHEVRLQKHALNEFGYEIPECDIYRERVSGETIDARFEFQKVMKRLENEEIIGCLCVDPERLTRGDTLECGLIIRLFKYTKTLVITPEKTFDLNNEYDVKYFKDRLERGNDFLEYTKKVLARGRKDSAVNEGKYISSVPPYGYERKQLKKGYTLAINEDEAQYVRLIFKWHNEGTGMTTISNRLNELGAKPRKSKFFTINTIRQIISNEVYIGKIKYQSKKVEEFYQDGKVIKKVVRQKDYTVVDGLHPAIIDEDTFNKAQDIRGKVDRGKHGTELKNMYAGLLYCKECGKAMNLFTYDTCATYRVPRYQCRSLRYCSNKSSNASIVHEAIQKALKSTLNDFQFKVDTNNRKELEGHENLLKSLEKQLEELEVRQEELYDFLEKKLYTPDVFIKRNEKLAEERERLKEAIKKVKETMPTIKDYEDKISSLHKCLDMLSDDSKSVKAKNVFLKGFINRIDYFKDDDGIAIDIFLR